MIHYFHIDDLKLAVPADYLLQCAGDDGHGQPDESVLEWARQTAEDEVIAYVEAAPSGYDADEWQVDENDDGISDNVNGLVKSLALDIAIYKIASRRIGGTIPDSIQRKYDIADLKLQRIQAGTLLLINEPATLGDGEISGNMSVTDLGELTENGEPLQWSDMP